VAELKNTYLNREKATLSISVTNVAEVEILTNKAKKEALQLLETIKELENLDLEIKFE